MPEDKKEDESKGKGKGKEGENEDAQATLPIDARVQWFEERVCNGLKVKSDKWKKLITVNENVEAIYQFLDKEFTTIMFYLNQKEDLVSCVNFPSQIKRKSIYFLKKRPGAQITEKLDQELFMGDISANPLEFLSIVLEEVYLPLLTNPKNLESWPEVVANDVLRHFHQLNGAVYVISGKAKGKTMLPLPHGAKLTSEADRTLLHTLESAVIDWTHQIKDVIKSSSAAPLEEGLNPGPMVEIDFWSAKAANLKSIHQQLTDEKIQKISKVLQLSKSTYYPAFQSIFDEIVFALEEASDINTYLKALRPQVERLAGASELAELSLVFPGLMHTLLLIWKSSKHYNTANRLTVIIQEICNDIIEQARNFIQPAELFTSEPEEAAERLRLVLRICETFKNTYFETKAATMESIRPWNFDSKLVFGRFDNFLVRIRHILELFETIIEFNRLEKIEIGGTKGKILSSQVAQIFTEFVTALSAFSKLKYDVLNIALPDFDLDRSKFHERITDLDRRIGTILCQAFDDCSGLYSCFRLLESFSGLLNRPNIQRDFEQKYFELLKMYSQDLDDVSVIFLRYKDNPPIHYNMAPITGAVGWIHELKDRVSKAMEKLKSLNHAIMNSDEANTVKNKYNELMSALDAYEQSMFNHWKGNIIDESESNLNKPILVRENGLLRVNFDPKVVALLREVKYFGALTVQPPPAAVDIYAKAETFRKYIFSLENVANMYNGIRTGVIDVERPLIEGKIAKIDAQIEAAVTSLNWRSENIDSYIVEITGTVGNLSSVLQVMKNNLSQINKILKQWSATPLIERKDGKKLLNLEEKETKLTAANELIRKDGQTILGLVDQTRQVVEAEPESEQWARYRAYVDAIVQRGFWTTIKASMDYILQNMDKERAAEVGPLLEAKLELENEFLVYTPSMEEDSPEGLLSVMESLLEDIYDVSALMARVAPVTKPSVKPGSAPKPESISPEEGAEGAEGGTAAVSSGSGEGVAADGAEHEDQKALKNMEDESYLGEMRQDDTLNNIRIAIMERVSEIIENCVQYKDGFEQYTYLWTENRQEYMKQFLQAPNKDAEEAGGETDGDESRIQLEKFEAEIRKFEGIHKTVMALDPEVIFQGWFRIDARPLKQSLNVVVKKWSYTLTKHLSDDTVTTLNELNTFVKHNKKGLQVKIEEGDYDGLVSAMGLLHAIKHRTGSIDKMFEPLRKTVNLLRQFGVELPEEVHKLLNDLPEEWSEVKKLSVTIKDYVAPLQAKEVDVLQQKCNKFEMKNHNFREEFRKKAPFKFEIGPDRSYELIDMSQFDVLSMEVEAAALKKSCELFELNVPTYRQLADCRRDVGMLKSIWDLVSLVTYMFGQWKTTLWTEIDTDAMENRCRDLSKELRKMDKEIKGWDAYAGLDQMVKDMITSLRAVGELRSNAIRDRHWKQLMKTTGVTFVLTKDMKFQDLLSLQLHKYEDNVKVIVDRATKELAMEKVINDLEKTWSTMEFTYEIHESTKTPLLRSSEELIETLEDNQVMLQNMMMSKYVAFFEEQITKWQIALSTVDSVTTLWLEVQKTWSHLENIFLGSEDIRAQLPEDSRRFDNIDASYKALMMEAQNTPNCTKACTKEGLYDKLEHLQGQLALCEKSLAEYLETKRLAFPRFYFVSATDLLDILAKGNIPQAVAVHLSKLFDSMTQLEFQKGPNGEPTKTAVGMYSREDEYVPFVEKCECTGPVEMWLNALVDSMRKTLRHLLGEAVASYEEKPREQWIFDHPAQITLAGTQIWWTTEVNAAFGRLEEGYENALKDYYKKQVSQLTALISLIQGQLTGGNRQMIMTVCTLDVHARDIVAKLIAEKAENAQCFSWQSQLRLRWDDVDQNDCFINIADAVFRYNHEYLGNSPRLVVTALTDRCYITLTQSLHLIMGGAPAGPAGTGKCWGRGTRLVMYDGSLKSVEDIVENDLLMGPDSKPRVVCPGSLTRGHGPMYRIKSKDSTKIDWTCNGDHILVLRNTAMPVVVENESKTGYIVRVPVAKTVAGEQISEESSIAAMQTISDLVFGTEAEAHEFVKDYVTKHEQLEFECIVNDYVMLANTQMNQESNVMFQSDLIYWPAPEQTLAMRLQSELKLKGSIPVELVTEFAWAVGVWLSSGNNHHVVVTHIDVDCHSDDKSHVPIVERLEKLQSSLGANSDARLWHADKANNGSKCTRVDLGSVFVSILESYGFLSGKSAASLKTFPVELQRESLIVRRSILAGFIDGNGCFDKNDFGYKLSSATKSTIEGVAQLARSVGLRVGPQTGSKALLEETAIPNTEWQVSVTGSCMEDLEGLMALRHKRCYSSERKNEAQMTNVYQSGFEIEAIGNDDYFGFTLRNPDGSKSDGRCLLEDFTVTHNTETVKDLGKALAIMVYVFNCSEQMDYKSIGNIFKGLAQSGAWGCFDEFNRISVEVLSVVATQVKSIQDALRARKKRFIFQGEEIGLVRTVGEFITMNPGYAGRTELPENIKALFRPCSMVVPNLELICEIMLMAEGFIEASSLARKFNTLYKLNRELLSKQDHYDWGLRAIKSVLVVAGSLKRADPNVPEEHVLMRALRDFNLPKIVTDDLQVFHGLIGDLFPKVEVPRKRNEKLEDEIRKATIESGLQPEEIFVLKIVQLEELMAVRHCVFIIGNGGTGKSQIWKMLAKTYINMGRKCTTYDLNPKAVSTDDLFGCINPSTREWKDGLFSCIMREMASAPGVDPKWMILDGDIDPNWIESLNCFPANDHQVLTSKGFMLLEDVQAHFSQHETLEIACYVDGQLEYHAITKDKLTIKEGKHTLVDFKSKTNAGRHVDLSPTTNHRMYAMIGSTQLHDGGKRIWRDATPEYRILRADEVLAAGEADESTVAQLRANAERGYTPSQENLMALPFVSALGLKSEAQVYAFLELYGQWLGNGVLNSANRTVSFSQVEIQDCVYFERLLTAVGLQESCDGYCKEVSADNHQGMQTYTITARHWYDYFAREYGHMHEDSCSEVAASELSSIVKDTSSSKWFFSWVHRDLGNVALRAIIRGLKYANKETSSTIRASSVRFRDELTTVLLHAGFSTHFEMETDSTSATTIYWNVWFSDKSHASQPQLVVRDECATRTWTGTVWCVTVPTEQNLIVFRRVQQTAPDGTIMAASRPVVVGNTVMDDNKMLTLASNERIPLKSHMRLIFEIGNLKYATPATVSRAGILYLNTTDLGWSPYVQSWLEKREDAAERSNLSVLFDRYINPCLEACRSGRFKMAAVEEFSMIVTLCNILEGLLTPANTPKGCDKEWFEIYFVFAAVWAFGGCVFQDQMVDYRNEFSKWWSAEFKVVKFPPSGTVFDYYVDTETKRFLPWTDRVPAYEFDPEIPLQAVLVHTSETTRIRYFLDLLADNGKPVLLIGNAGCGKCWGAGTRLVMFDGSSKPVEKIVEGDLLMGDDSAARTVMPGSVIRGFAPMYRVKSAAAGNLTWTCNGAHILVMRLTRRPWVSRSTDGSNTWCILETRLSTGSSDDSCVPSIEIVQSGFESQEDAIVYAEEYTRMSWTPPELECTVDDYIANRKAFKAAMPKMFQSSFIEWPAPVDSLFERLQHHLGRAPSADLLLGVASSIGLWLTLGSDVSATIMVTESASQDVIDITGLEWVAEQLGASGEVVHGSDIRLGTIFLKLLRDYNLVSNKHLPLSLRTESPDVRMALLAGIVDGSGTLLDNGRSVEVRLAGRELMDELVHLARGLGLVTSQVTAVSLSVKEDVHVCGWSTRIGGESLPSLNAHLLSPSKRQCMADNIADPRCAGFEIEPIGDNFYYGFTLNQDSNSRCLLEDFVVTHNTVLMQDKLNSYGEDRLIVNVPFNFYTTAWSLQAVLEKPLEKKAGRNFGPPGNKKIIYFLDDLNMPEVDKYGTASPHTLLRQFLDYRHWYDRSKLTLKEIHNCQYVACMNPTAGSFTIDPRLQRHFACFSVNFPDVESLQSIYLQILTGHLKSFPTSMQKLAERIVSASLLLHKKVAVTFLPTAVKFHYIFNLRDLSNIFQGILFSTKEKVKDSIELVRLFFHETSRTYGDKMIDDNDRLILTKIQEEIVKKNFEDMDQAALKAEPNIFTHFAGGMGEPKYGPIKDWALLRKLLDEAQLQYEEVNAAMNLVLFEDAMSHICRINRILESPRGNALLVGVGGSGKQSLSRLAAFISQMEVFQITLRKGYSVTDLKTDLAALFIKTGQKKMQIMFLLTDSQISDEKFLVLINDLLASGNIPGLFADEETESIINSMRGEAKAQGIVDTREACWDIFIRIVRRNLKVVLCFSPVGNTLRSRCRKFPAIVNCTMIDWFQEWPEEALTSVANRFISSFDLVSDPLKVAVTKFMSFAHMGVNAVSRKYLLNEKRYNYTTPKSFLALISLYKEMLEKKALELTKSMDRLENGLTKLQATAGQVDDLKAKLATQEVELKSKNEEANRLIERVAIDTEKVNKEKAIAAEEEKKVDAITKEVGEKQASCMKDLSAAEPALAAASNALNTLNKANLTELKSFGSPSEEVKNVAAACMVLLSPPGKIAKDRSWKASKNMMAKVDAFLESLITFNKESIDQSNLDALQPYLQDPNFNEEFMRSKSIAAASLCAWAVNIVAYYHVYCDVEPKRKALEAANAELQSSQARLRDIQAKISELDRNLGELRAKFEKATADKLKCEEEAKNTQETIVLANRLVNGLASEKVRWSEAVGKFKEQEKTIAGDVLISAAFVSYVGCFSKRYREELLNDNWLRYLRDESNPNRVPLSEGVDPLSILTNSAEIAKWNNEGLPTDRVSLENATMVTSCKRWPLIIDPQLQGVTWIKNREGASLKVVRLGARGYLDSIEKAVSSGDAVLIEDIAESIDPVLNPLLGRETIKKGRYIKMGDKEVEYDQRFKLILQTRRANPHYPPEIQAQTTLINFTVTIAGLEDQLLADVVNIERPDLERTKAELTKQQNEFKIKLTELEDALLSRLSAAQGNFLGDTALVENLEITKSTATDIEQKVEEAKRTEKKINETRELYRPVAARSSLLYFLLNDLWQIHPMYQYSLNAYKVVFQNAINHADASEDIKERVLILIDSITYMVFVYTSRGLFERDKLIFTAQMTFQILLSQADVEYAELDFLLRAPRAVGITSTFDWLPSSSWAMIKSLSTLEVFRTLASDIEGSSKQWKKYCENECPENEKLPQEWKNKTPLQKMCILRCLRPDRMTYAMRNFVGMKMGQRFIESARVPLAKSFEESASATPIFFILSPGVDPVKEVEALGRQLGISEDLGNFHNVSLGQGQEVIAEQKLDIAYKNGGWVMLENIHLVAKWLSTLEKKLELLSVGAHPDYRVFLSAEPAGDPAYHIIPISILQASIKITNEPPTGMLANIHRALDNFSQETLERCSKDAEFKAILFALCYFHAVVLERRKFGTMGWNKPYPFSTGDLMISTDVLFNYLEGFAKVPWTDLRYIFGEIMYGGHISDDWDRRLCSAYLDVYLREELLEGTHELAPGFPSPPTSDYKDYHRYIDENLPPEAAVLYGLHPNAEILVLTKMTDTLFKTILEMQPRDSVGGAASSKEERVKAVLDEIMEKLPDSFNVPELVARVEERTPYISVALQECDRMSMLTTEIRRSLKELELGLKGDLTISENMELLMNSLFMNEVPIRWEKLAYPSMQPLSSWYGDLLQRIKELETWVAEFNLPSVVWLPGLFNPQSFLTAIMQTTARKNEWPLDRMVLTVDVTKKAREEFSGAPREGAYIHGMNMSGARWDTASGMIQDSLLKELAPAMPVIYIKAIPVDKKETKGVYECPVYRTRQRGPTFIWTFNLKTKERPQKWILAGVCLLCSAE